MPKSNNEWKSKQRGEFQIQCVSLLMENMTLENAIDAMISAYGEGQVFESIVSRMNQKWFERLIHIKSAKEQWG